MSQSCVASCWYAKSPIEDCECACEGENHGRGMEMPEAEIMPPEFTPGHYTGTYLGGRVLRPDGSPLANDSPTGFAWGFTGKGAGALARGILLDHGLEPDVADRHFQQFRDDVIAHHSWGKPLKLPRSDVEAWIARSVTGVRV